MKKTILPLVAAVLLFACQKNDRSGAFKGPDTMIRQGKTWSSVRLDKEGVPQQLILTIDSNALRSVQSGDNQGHQHENSVIVPLHPKAVENTPFKFVMLDWVPNGHPPAGLYDSAHFDIHFYMAPQAEVMNYLDVAKLESKPASDYIPAMHIDAPGVPLMGKHWLDLTSPEFNGQLFTQTFIYGSYDGKVVFYEPMMSLNFLNTTTGLVRPLPQPAKFRTSGYYPTRMKVVKHERSTDIILEGFEFRQGS